MTIRLSNAAGEVLAAGFDAGPYPGFFIDRGGTRGFRSRWFADKATWSAPPGTTTTDLRLIMDRTSIELIGSAARRQERCCSISRTHLNDWKSLLKAKRRYLPSAPVPSAEASRAGSFDQSALRPGLADQRQSR